MYRVVTSALRLRIVRELNLRVYLHCFLRLTPTDIILLVFIGLFFSFLNADDPIRLLGNVTVFATIVLWVFVILLDVPRVSYQTRLDSFLIASFACIFAMALLHGA
jgi:hypothetical protein